LTLSKVMSQKRKYPNEVVFDVVLLSMLLCQDVPRSPALVVREGGRPSGLGVVDDLALRAH